MNPRLSPVIVQVLLTFVTLVGLSGRAGAATYFADFSSDPSPALTVFRSSAQVGQRFPTGGNTGGHFVLTPASTGQRCVVKLPDLDPAKAVSTFDIRMDCRIGGGSNVPADGMSINFALAGDPVLTAGTGFLPSPDGGADSPDEGTATGLSVCMDAWDNGGSDWVGFTVKHNGAVIAQAGADLRHGGLTESASLQTGPINRSGGDTTSLLGWAPLRIILYHTGRLDVFWKNVRVINSVQTYWVPASGYFVIGARTGGAAQLHDIDNLTVTTTAATTALVEVTPRPARVQFAFIDAPNALVLNSLALRINGASVPVSDTVNASPYKRFAWLPVSPLVPGADYNYSITATGGINVEGTFRAPVYARIAASKAVAYSNIDTSAEATGVRIVTRQTEAVRPDTILDAERQLRGDFGGNTADSTGAAEDGSFIVPFVNFEENAQAEGYFTAATTIYETPQDRLVPGIPGSRTSGNRDNYVVEATAYVSLPAGLTRMAVRSDDGFKLTCGLDARSPFAQEIARFDGGRAAWDSEFDIYVDAAGYYPFRLLWFEGGGGSSCEWYVILTDGRKVPVGGHRYGTINPTVLPARVDCFARLLPSFSRPRFIDWVEPPPGATGVPAGRIVTVTTGGAREPGFTLTVDGQPAFAEAPRGSSTFSILPATVERFWVDPGESHTVGLTLDGVTRTWSFTREVYGVLPVESYTRFGTGRNPGFNWRIFQTAKANPDGNDAAEEILAGVFGPNIATPAAPSDWSYDVSGFLNFSHDGSAAGLLTNDAAMPGLTGSLTNAAVEVLGYLEMPVPGFRTLAVTSDDGFRLSTSGMPHSPLRIVAPSNFSGYTPAVESLMAPVSAVPVRGSLAIPNPADASGPLLNAAQLAGKIALVDRSDNVLFSDQIRRCQNAGAIGVIVINTAALPSIRMTGRGFPAFTIPAVMISGLLGVFIKLDPAPFIVELARDRTGILGEFDGGRGAGETKFTFFVPIGGVYPVRMTYEQGGGGANVELYHYYANGGLPVPVGTGDANSLAMPMLYRNRLEPVSPTRLDYVPATRQFRAWLPLTAGDFLHVDRSFIFDYSVWPAWQTVQELSAAPAAGQPYVFVRPQAPDPASTRQFFRFEALRSLEPP